MIEWEQFVKILNQMFTTFAKSEIKCFLIRWLVSSAGVSDVLGDKNSSNDQTCFYVDIAHLQATSARSVHKHCHVHRLGRGNSLLINWQALQCTSTFTMFIQPSSNFQLSEGRSIEQQDISTLPCLLKTLIIGFCGMSKKYPHPNPPSIILPLSVPNHMNMRHWRQISFYR